MVVDEGAVNAHRDGGARRQIEHVAVTQQLFGAALVEALAATAFVAVSAASPASSVASVLDFVCAIFRFLPRFKRFVG